MSALTPDALAEIDPERIGQGLASLAAGFTEPGEAGWTRRVFSDPYRDARDHMRRAMHSAGLEVRIDAAGNIIGRLPGAHPEAPALMTGSHTDTVSGGGRFDGMVGVLGAIEAARAIRESGLTLDRDLYVVDFLGEEANDFGVSCIGSRSIAGVLTAEHLTRTDRDGVTLGATMERFGADPAGAVAGAWAPGALHGYVELHIEQGPLLERSRTQIGVVTAIAGIERLMAQFVGRGDHAGTMPMEMRHDALLAAAEAVLTVEQMACAAPIHGVATTGRILAEPGAFNVVPDRARIWTEVRSIDPTWLHGAKRRIAERIAEDASRRHVDTMVEWLNDQPPVSATTAVQDLVAASAGALGLSWEAVPSGAGHDAAHIAGIAPMGMIFVPSIGGRSHVPEEETPLEDIANGAATLARTLIAMDSAELTH